MIGMKGLVASPSGDIIELPVKATLSRGSMSSSFLSRATAPASFSDTALRTANAGYLTRRLVDVAQDVVVMEEDCGDTVGEVFTKEQSEQMGERLTDRVLGRFLLVPLKAKGKTLADAGEVVTEQIARQIQELGIETIHVRSVLQCTLPKGVCIKCYGYDLSHNQVVKKGVAVGIIAAQSIGEPGTQLTMRTFHLGGIAGGGHYPGCRAGELFEARNRAEAVLAEVGGRLPSRTDKDHHQMTGRKIFE